MPAGLTTAAKTVMLTALDGVIGRMSLHSADPGAAGTANELSGGSPAYARKTVAFTVTGASMATDADVVFDCPPGSTAAWIGYWSADGSTFYGADDLSDPEEFTGQGTYTVPAGQAVISG